MKNRIVTPVVGFALLLLGASAVQWIYFRNTLKIFDDRTGRVAFQALSRLLAQAHRTNDDLIQQEAIQGITRAPGILFACVLDPDNKVIAHTQPAQLGKQFARPHPSKAVIKGYALQDAQETWGRLVLGLSRQATRMHLLKEALLLLSFNLCGGVSMLWGWRSYQQLTQRHQKERSSFEFHIQELENELERRRRAQAADQAQWSAWMNQALERIPRPALYLDSSQRLTACNQAAAHRLGITAGETPRGTSWQDIPVLAGCGDDLQRALDCPDQGIVCSRAGAGVEFVSEKPPGGTWVFFR